MLEPTSTFTASNSFVNTLLVAFMSGDLFAYVGLALALFFWMLIVFRTIKDITARTDNTALQFLSAFAVILLTPLLGLPLYLVLRPKFYKHDRLGWREAIVLETIDCPNCSVTNSLEYNVCVACGEVLKISCRECQKKYIYFYHYCPDC